MGGLGGHIQGIFEDPSLTFLQIKDILVKASGGDLFISEKTDGVNIFLSYSVKTGEAKAARNSSNIKSGGLNYQELASKFQDRGSLTNAFKEAFETWENAIKTLNPQTQMNIFGDDTDIFYSAEIMGGDSQNILNYDTKTLVIHSTGHSAFDK